MNLQEAKFDYAQRMGDTSLILGHRISEWCGHGPILETDIALTNVALDLVGQATTILDYAGTLEGKGRTNDDLAYLRDAVDYKNLLLCEQENGDFGKTIARSFLFDTFHFFFLQELAKSKDETFAAYAEKSLKEVTYHLRHSSEWTIRLGDGTEESRGRIQDSFDDLWMYTGELFDMNEVDEMLIKEGIVPDLNEIKVHWNEHVDAIFSKATLQKPENGWMQKGGKVGRHTELLGFLLAEMQFLQRSYPGCEW